MRYESMFEAWCSACVRAQDAAYRCREAGAQYVLLGSGGQEGDLKKAAETDFKDHPDIK